MTFEQFFTTATGGNEPYDYQRRLAEDSACHSQLIEIPTGLGKTAAVVLAWLWNRVHLQQHDWPRRLVYCLPMRTLVEQTAGEVKKWIENLHNAAERLALSDRALDKLQWLKDHSPVILMGGEESGDWDIHPERDAILIGTQDMLLSRALNRGYGMSRYRWPMHFALLNNDALWVMDEVQLMGSGLPTTAQLEAFRQKLATHGDCRSWWMSATSDRGWLETVDFKPETLAAPIALSEPERTGLSHLLDALKPLERATVGNADLKKLADEIVAAAEKSDGLTLVVVNTVKTARQLHAAVRKKRGTVASEAALLHSRFRPDDRAWIFNEIIKAENTRRLVISTQVVEAGVDLSTAVLFTELAPWSSLVQRFGRCNRRGKLTDARVVWFEAKDPAPYEPAQLKEARDRLLRLTGVSPNQLRAIPIPDCDRPAAGHVIRRKDLLELFDTTPDLAGNDLDIDRWVREVDDSSVQLFWRAWEGKPAEAQPNRRELCPASITEFRDFLEKTGSAAWRWDYLEGEWRTVKANEVYPGQVYLLPAEAGGYVADTGWTPDSKSTVEPITATVDEAEDKETEDEPLSQRGQWQSIAQHTDKVFSEIDTILSRLTTDHDALLRHAARWHDWGKAHPAFQAKLKLDAAAECLRELGAEPMAKAPKEMWRSPKLPAKPRAGDLRRKYFRHELASALAILQPGTLPDLPPEGLDLVAYLVAAHHGKVRLSIRSLPGEWAPDDDRRFARGVWDGDPLPDVFLGGEGEEGIITPACKLSLEPMELGLGENSPFTNLPSWSDRMLALRDTLGPFRLAHLEALLRAADERASALASQAALAKGGTHEPARTNSAMAGAPARGAVAPQSRARAGERLLEHVDGGGAGESPVVEGDTRPAGATRTLETARGELTYAEVADLLAPRIAELLPAIASGAYGESPLDESLLARLHRELCGDLVPAWAGIWRLKEVTVGTHSPPAFHAIATLLLDYARDLAARWDFLSGDDEELLIETLAFAEGRLLFIHPFQDFNGRVARLWLREILRRAGLPEVRLEVRDAEEKSSYYAALHAADGHDLAPLKAIWCQRFAEAL